jgi:hypothetical protein
MQLRETVLRKHLPRFGHVHVMRANGGADGPASRVHTLLCMLQVFFYPIHTHRPTRHPTRTRQTSLSQKSTICLVCQRTDQTKRTARQTPGGPFPGAFSWRAGGPSTPLKNRDANSSFRAKCVRQRTILPLPLRPQRAQRAGCGTLGEGFRLRTCL